MCADQEIPAETVQGLSEPLMKTQVHGRQEEGDSAEILFSRTCPIGRCCSMNTLQEDCSGFCLETPCSKSQYS